MDPVGPWSAYASYNRLAGVQSVTGSGELHHHLTPSGSGAAPPTTTTQLLSGSFLSPPPVGYETVFSPLFHHASTKPPTHYVSQVAQHRQALAQAQAVTASKQTTDAEYHQSQGFFEQGATAWQQNSPFGILPHESVVPTTTTSKATNYENFNAHFAATQSLNHLNSQLAVVNTKTSTARAQSPQVSNTSAKQPSANQSNTGSFFPVPTTFSGTDVISNNKSFVSTNSTLQQSCIVSSSNTPVSKEYRVPQTPTRAIFLTSSTPARIIEKSFVALPTKQAAQIQTKAQIKIYSELPNHSERRQTQTEENHNQSSPISFSIMDTPGRINYTGSNSSTNKRPQFQHSTNYRHYQPGNNTETEFQRPKNGSDYTNSNGPDCNVVIPRRPSPLQAHSQASPLGHAPSPVYPMYNSPMNSIASPQSNTNNQGTPTTPLDVSVSRPNSQSNSIAYQSVITRALNTEKTFSDRYEHGNQQNAQSNQNCWEDRTTQPHPQQQQQQQHQQRKLQTQPNSPVNSYNTVNNIEVPSNRSEQRTNTVMDSVTERQQSYFESNQQVGLQDLSSCRGDPMSIVKNLQQQSCQVQQVEVKQEVKMSSKRRKSSEKPNVNEVTNPAMAEYFAGRIPPPAHSSAANPQQQNGAYFDFDRWNLPPQSSKIFSTQTIHQQHQGLMVPHPHSHHPPPPLPYFTPLHFSHHPAEFSSSVELPSLNTYNDQSSQQPAPTQFSQQDDQPKVVVPNIEEELNFLSENTGIQTLSSVSQQPSTMLQHSSVLNHLNKTDKPTGPGAGFMNSYLKFLQGERDSSPPPPARGCRKQTWSRAKPIQQPDVKQETNGVVATPPAPISLTRLSQGDPQDDPRYFPLPKERKKNCFDSSDDGFSSDDDLFTRKVPPIVKPDMPKERNARKGRPPKAGGATERKRARQAASILSQHKEDNESKGTPTRRESTRRAAKEKSNIKQLMAKQTGDDDLEEFVDSDSDPAWTPQARDDLEEEIAMKKGKKTKHGRRKASRNLISAAAYCAGIREADGYTSDTMGGINKKEKVTTENKQVYKNNVAPHLEDNTLNDITQQNNISTVNNEDNNLFKLGEFVVIKSELHQEWPSIWRVDGKTLLQKYEPFEQNGETLYRNISTYTSWTPESKKQYISIPVRYKLQGQLETIVKFLRNELLVIDSEVMKRAMKNSEGYQDNFEVYIQTLISQALDSNFLTEIFQEQDEYFLTNVKTIDDITDNKRHKLLNVLKWPNPVQVAVTTWPCFNIINELSTSDIGLRLCAACSKIGVAVRVLMYGQPYNSTTLEGCQPNTQTIEKDFLMCRICATRVELFNKITHQKYLMYIECAKRVTEKRSGEPHKDTTCILNELLADENWLTQLFNEVRISWAEVDSLEHSYEFKNSTV